METKFEEGDIVKIIGHHQYEGSYGVIYKIVFKKHQYHRYKILIVAKRNKRCYAHARMEEFFSGNLRKENDKDTIKKVERCISPSLL